MKSLEFWDRNKKEFDWENEELQDDAVVEEGQPKLVHTDIIAETPGVELESDYNKVIDRDLQEETPKNSHPRRSRSNDTVKN